MKTIRPIPAELAGEWDDQKDISEVSQGSGYRARWRCRHDGRHRWEASVKNRVKGSGCPYCAGRKVLSGVDDISTTHPHLAEEWSPENTTSPEEVSAGSSRKVRWTCSAEGSHRWEATVYNRVQGSGCPYCAGQRAVAGVDDLSSLHPELAAQWSEENASSPSQVLPMSSRKVQWVCEKDAPHQWEAVVSSRVQGSGCPYCTGQRAVTGVNDLATTHPQLASEWDDDRDIGEISSGSEYRAF